MHVSTASSSAASTYLFDTPVFISVFRKHYYSSMMGNMFLRCHSPAVFNIYVVVENTFVCLFVCVCVYDA